MRFLFFLLSILLMAGLHEHAFSQNLPVRLIKGRVVDAAANQPLAGATIQLLKSGKKTPVAGTVSGTDGKYKLETGNGEYEVIVEYAGYQLRKSATFRLTDAVSEKDLGDIRLAPAVAVLQEVVVQAEKSSMQLALDRKIFNVGKDLANAGGSASDILMNIPSVSVDPEGSVKLRGSDNVRILIDGKPSGLVSIKGGSGLNNLQAAMVERVEIITNPSARYEAEGNAGIINIILKKDRRQGFNGSFEVIGGNPTNYGLAANLNYRKDKINFFVNYGVAYRIQPSRGRMTQELYGKDTVRIMKQHDNAELLGFNNNIRAGLDYFFTEKSVLTLAYLYRRSQGNRRRTFVYDDYLFNLNNLQTRQGRTQDEDETEPNTEITVNYKRSFAQKGHELTAEVKYLDYWENSDQTFEQWPEILGGRPVSSAPRTIQRSLNDEWEKQYLLQLDYVKPIGSEGKFETGIRSSFRNMVNDYVVSERNASGGLDPLPGLDNVFEYDENIHAAYGILGNRSGKLSYQGGLRAEWTDVTTILRETGQRNPRNYGNFFPSAHLTYNLPNDHGIQISYSRRVRRPVYNDLSPYSTFSDARNFNGGNPDLDPEFSDVFELGHLKSFPKGAFSASVYFRNTTEKIERIRQVDAKGNAFTQPQNLLGEKAYGIEAQGSVSPKKWWKMDANINFFHARVDGSNILAAYKTETFSWFARQTSRFSLKHDLDIQLRMNYEARQRLVQGSRKGYFFTDLSFSKDIMAQRGTLTLNVMDVFNSRKVFYIIEGPGFHTDALMGFRPRQINMTFTYRIKQAKGTKTVKMINAD
jgi:ferric enterobactin receptor